MGTGYVGLVTGACLADVDHDVVCVDSDERKVAALNAGRAFLHEPGLQDVLDRRAGRGLRATRDLAEAVRGADVTMICVGTPSRDGAIDLSQVEGAAEEIGRALADHPEKHVVVVKSTVVPGTTEDVVAPVLERASGRRVGDGLGLAMNPEFLREGNAVEDFARPDRIVLGVADGLAEERLRELYRPYRPVDLVVTTPRTAETIKYTANALLATLISFSNEIGNLVATLPGVDVGDVMEGVHLDRRLSPILEDGRRIRPGLLTYLAAGCGFGGSCFPKDVQALRAFARGGGLPSEMLDAVLSINARQPHEVLALLERGLGPLRGRRVTVLGLAFKPGTDDVRESPSLVAIRELLEHGAEVTAFDPVADETGRAVLDGEVRVAGSLREAVAGAEGVAVMTAWPEFQTLAAVLDGVEPAPLVVDGRRALDGSDFVRYLAIGAGPREGGAA